tara:strand:+ start:207 stop:353 length:147 start_codon:yes stop_codon:yes gene_type:complete
MNSTKKNKVDAGSCNFCTREHDRVNVITGELYLEVRMCDKCLKDLKNL